VGDAVLSRSLDALMAGKVAAEARLDLLTAAEARQSTASVSEKLRRYRSTLPKDDPLGGWRDTLAGGDAGRGRKIFNERADVQCLRCHSIKGDGGSAGPDLAGIGAKQTREYLLESMVFPAKHIAAGWETVTVRVKNGDTFAGVLKSEDARQIVLVDPEKGELRVEKALVTGRRGGQTAMPGDIAQPLSKHDLRDLVEFLAGLR
jgi:quinoprotein glucose dehydrogenase